MAPTELITDGQATVDLRITNIFDKEMTNTLVKYKDVSSIYVPISEQEGVSVGNVLPGQTYPVIMTIKGSSVGTLSGKNIEVCFDYETEYYFDIGLKDKTKAAEKLSVESGASSGPMNISVVGLENVFYENEKATGALTLKNNWQGRIKQIDEVTIQFPLASGINSGSIAISDCSGTSSITESQEGCSILSNEVAIANGLTLRANVEVDSDEKGVAVERVLGTVNYNYCYEIPLPTITIKSV